MAKMILDVSCSALQVRGRCWVLRGPRPARKVIRESRQTARGFVSAAWVLFVLLSVAVVAFRNEKICRTDGRQ